MQSKQTEAINVRTASRGNPWIKLQSGRSVAATYKQASTETESRSLNGARPLSLAAGDFNADGFPDLVCGYASGNSAFVSVNRGDVRAFAPEDPDILKGIGIGQFPDPFLPDALLVRLPESPDFLGTLDFDRDGYMDIVTASRGSDGLYLLLGDGRGGFGSPQRITLPGYVTAMITGESDPADLAGDVIIGLNTPNGSVVLTYEGKESLFEATPTVHALPGKVESISLGRLDDDQFPDLAIVAEGQVLVLHGRSQSDSDNLPVNKGAGEIESIALPFRVKALALGEFIWDRDARSEMALLSDDGSVHIVARGQLDTRPFTAEEMMQKRIALERTREEMQVASSTLRPVEISPAHQVQHSPWEVVEDLSLPTSNSFAPAGGPDGAAPPASAAQPVLLSTRISTLPSDDLVIMNPDSGEFAVLYREGVQQDESRPLTESTTRSAVPLEAEGQPVAILPMRLSVDGRPGLVVLTKDSTAPRPLLPQAAVTYHVTNIAADSTITCTAPVGGISNCTTLRAAIIASNANVGADTIVFDVNGTYLLSITGSDNAAATGDLDINDSLTITGNGSANTIISTNYTNTCGDCKVFGINQDGTHNGLTVSFTGVTIQNGFNGFNASCGVTFQETGGGVDFFLTGTGNSYSMTNSIITNNKATGTTLCNRRHGGGVNVDSSGSGTVGGPNLGTVTFTGCTISKNMSENEGGGLNLAADKHDVNVTNSTIGGPLAADGNQTTVSGVGGGIDIEHSFGGTVTMNGGSIQNNTAAAAGGGLVITFNPNASISNVTISNNTASSGGAGSSTAGGVAIIPTGVAGFTPTISLSGCNINTNHADNGIAAQGGGVYFESFYSASVSNCTISSNTSGAGAGVFNGGSSATPAATLTVDSGSTISSNAATAGGGGVANVNSANSVTTLNGITIDSNTAGSGGDGIDEQGGTITLQGTINLNGGDGINIANAGTFTSTSGTLNLSGSFTRASTATFNHNSGTINFNGSGAQNINGTATSETFNHFTVNKSGSTLSVGGSTTALTIAGNVTLTAGTFAAGTATAIGLTTGNWTNNGGVFTPGSSVVTFSNTTGAQSINGTNATQTFNGIAVAKSAQTLSVGGNTTSLILNGTMLLTSGTFAAGTATAINVAGDWTNNGGTFTPGNGTVTFNGSGAQNLNGSAATQTFNNFTVSKSGGTLTGGGSTTTLNLNGNMAITSGTLAAGTLTAINVPGNWANSGTFTAGSSTVTFNGANSTQTLTGTTIFNNLTSNHTGTGSVTASGSSLTVNGLMRAQAGTFTSSSTFNNVQIDSAATLASDGSPMNVSGNWTNNGGTFTPNGNIVDFNGGGAQTIGGTALTQTFANFIINKSGGTLSVGGSTTTLTITNDLTLTAGTFDKGTANTINVAGNWTKNGGTFTPGAGTVNFNGSSAQVIGGTSATTFNNLTNSNANGISMNNDNTVNGVLALTSSDITVANTKTLTMPSTGSSSGGFDVNGNVLRTGFTTGGSALSFGNPFNTIQVTAGTAPANILVNLVRSVPTGSMGYPTAVQRTYTITPSAGGFTGTLRLHYLDSELNGNTEGGLNLWRFDSGINAWRPNPATARDSINNWVEKTGVSTFSPWTLNSTNSPTATDGTVTGSITTSNGTPVSGVVVRLTGTQSRKTITDANGNYRFDNVETNGFYTVIPSRTNFTFTPAQRSFSQIGNNTEAVFTGSTSGDSANPLDTPEYFVRQQYVDLLGREPDEGGFNYWSDQILACGGDTECTTSRRRDVAAAFFIEQEYQRTGSYVYGLYKGGLARQPGYQEFSSDRRQLVEGPSLETLKQALAENFVARQEFVTRYQTAITADLFVDALLATVRQSSGVDLGSQRTEFIGAYNGGANVIQSRATVVRAVSEAAAFRQAEYNAAFVLTEYFGYLRRDAEPGGYAFWLDVISNRATGNYRGMVCAFITSTEYQQRFSTIVSHRNAECGP